jgi:hypothetical protein
MKTALAALLIAFASTVGAQGKDEVRGSTPLGTATDGSRPSDGAITGGSIQPGESGGIPKAGPAGPSGVPPEERIKRCQELSGTLREECLRKEERSSGSGGTQREVLSPSERSDKPSR